MLSSPSHRISGGQNITEMLQEIIDKKARNNGSFKQVPFWAGVPSGKQSLTVANSFIEKDLVGYLDKLVSNQQTNLKLKPTSLNHTTALVRNLVQTRTL